MANTTSRKLTIANSSDLDSDSEEDIVVSSGPRRSLVEVSIPALSRVSSKMTAVKAEEGSPTDSSGLSPMESISRDSVEYETPGTTPATSVRGVAGGKRKRSSLGKDVMKIEDSDAEVEDADGELAARLQEQEYAQFDAKPNKRPKMSKLRIEDTEDDESELSEPESNFSLDIPKFDRKTSGLQTQLQKAHKGKKVAPPAPAPSKGKKASLPNRIARSNARKSIAQTLHTKVEDSESELSDDDDFSEVASTGVSDAESDASQVSAGAGTTAGPSRLPPPKRAKSRKRAPRRRRPSIHTEDDDEDIAANIEEIIANAMLSRRERERKKLEKSHPDIITMWDTLEAIPVLDVIAAEQPSSINRKLKKFQLEGLSWMTRQEKTNYKGGLLGDEMGMGKTIQAVSLIMSDYPQKQPTLVVVPPVALMQWSSEIKEYTDGKLNVLVYHGQNGKIKNMSVKELKKFDVIMISYNSLESLYRKQSKGWSRGDNIIKEDSPIHAIHFHRLILDEAHSIKSRTTGVAKACFALTGTYKWCLSGTPVQNRIGEFFSLLRFLEVRPFADYFCKRCPCSILHWKLEEDHTCTACKHTGMEHVSVFNQELLNPLTQSDDDAVRKAAMAKLHLITARIMLRRMKRDYTSSMELPPKEVIVHNEFFGEIERDFSSSIMSNTARQFDTYVAKGVMLNNYANIFGLIMQMRQIANHPDLLLKKHAQEGQNVLVCNICDEVAEEAIRSQCKHDFCRSCVKSYLTSVEGTGGDADCPRCHIPLAIDLDQPDIEQDEDVVKKSSIINRIKMENWTSSTKIEMLVYDLYKLRSKKQTLKSIVFSQFTSMLQLIEWRLRRAGFNTVMLDGSMTPIQRQRSIEYFMTNTDVEVFLVSLKAGGVALNLTEASRVFIVDPWWVRITPTSPPPIPSKDC